MKPQRVSVGQSLVLIALMIVIMIAFAGITIDTGNATAEQRNIDAGANAAALASMNSVILNNRDSAVLNTMNQTLALNDVTNYQQVPVGTGWGSNKDMVYLTAEYLDASGAYLADVGSLGELRPAELGAAHVVVKTSTKVSTTFSKVAGVDQFTVSADGAAGSGPCVNGIFPVTPHKIHLERNLPGWEKPVTMESLGLSPFAEDADIPAMVNAPALTANSPRFRVYRHHRTEYGGMPGNFGWTRWNGNENNGTPAMLQASFTGSGNLANGFAESDPPAYDSAANTRKNGRLEVGDWIAPDSGNNPTAGLEAALNSHIAQKTLLILPFHDQSDGTGMSGAGYRVDRFVRVRLLSYQLVPASKSYFEFALVKDNVFCSTPETPPPPPTLGYPFRVDVTEQLQWYDPQTEGGSYDIAIVLDTSWSMRYCWTTNTTCQAKPSNPEDGGRRIDMAGKVLRMFVNEMLQVRNIQKGGDNRLALVTYGQSATQQIPFNNDTNQALAAFTNYLGTDAAPRNFGNDTDVKGNTNTTDGITKGVSYLNGARTVDKYGRPVRLAVLLLSDGLTNVFADGGNLQNKTNRYDLAPYFCGDSEADMDNPDVQATCPSDDEFPQPNKPTPPIRAMIKAADAARAAKPIDFFAVVMGAQNGLTPVDMYFHEVAIEGRYFMADQQEELALMVKAIAVQMGEPCNERSGEAIPAGGAKVTISHATGGVLGTYTTNAQGTLIVPNLLPGSYKISIAHTGVIAEKDPKKIPRNYTRMIVGDDPIPVTVTTIVMPKSSFTAPPIKLIIDDIRNAQCPVGS